MSLRVVVADDQPLVRAGLRVILDAQPDIQVVGEAADGQEAVDAVRRSRPDVALLDVRMPGTDGIEATRQICLEALDPRPRVLILTTFDLDEYVFGALRAGASGFILKDAPRESLVSAVRTVAAGDGLLAPSVTGRLIRRFVERTASLAPAAPSPELTELTAREREVLELMARGLSNAEIAQHLVLAEGTVKAHVSNLLSKLRLRDRVQAVIAAYELGLIRPGRRGQGSETGPGGAPER
jgi:DNA-binding NarL/FixJ family response regulator